jgi:putative ABC transport system permease protein
VLTGFGFPLGARLFFVESLRALGLHKLRTGLASLGIMFGVAAVIWVVAIGQAGAERSQAELQKLGDNFVWVEAGSRNVNGVRTGTHGTTTLMPDDADAMRNELPRIKSCSENVDGSAQVIYGNRNWATHYRGVSPEYLDIKRWRVAKGSFFTSEQTSQGESVVVLGETVREQLFGPAEAVGEVIRANNFLFRVIGVLAPKGQSPSGQDQDDTIVMPWRTAQGRILGRYYTYLDDILCSAVSMEKVEESIDDIRALLRQRHRIRSGEEDDFNIRRPDEALKAQVRAAEALALMLITLASIALAVGGVGIMNVMLASVAQRTQEIGLRVAVGATQTAVQLQFPGEAVMKQLFHGTGSIYAVHYVRA